MKKIFRRYKRGLISAIIVLVMGTGFSFDMSSLSSFFNINTGDNEIKLIKCIDGDTAKFSKIDKTRFLLIDTPESTNKIEEYGKVASKYTCNKLKKAKKITYEYDGAKKDKYGRILAYIFVDGKLLQEEIAKQGFVKKFYEYKSFYKYKRRISKAINDKYNIFERR